jgi:hypothetical protein
MFVLDESLKLHYYSQEYWSELFRSPMRLSPKSRPTWIYIPVFTAWIILCSGLHWCHIFSGCGSAWFSSYHHQVENHSDDSESSESDHACGPCIYSPQIIPPFHRINFKSIHETSAVFDFYFSQSGAKTFPLAISYSSDAFPVFLIPLQNPQLSSVLLI